MWGDFEVHGETAEVMAVPPGEFTQAGFVDEQVGGVAVGAVFLPLVEVEIFGVLVVVVGVSEFVGED